MAKKISYTLTAGFLGLMLYYAFTNTNGDLSPPGSVDHGAYRVGNGFRRLVGGANAEIESTRDGMQNAVDRRVDLQDGRIARDRD